MTSSPKRGSFKDVAIVYFTHGVSGVQRMEPAPAKAAHLRALEYIRAETDGKNMAFDLEGHIAEFFTHTCSPLHRTYDAAADGAVIVAEFVLPDQRAAGEDILLWIERVYLKS